MNDLTTDQKDNPVIVRLFLVAASVSRVNNCLLELHVACLSREYYNRNGHTVQMQTALILSWDMRRVSPHYGTSDSSRSWSTGWLDRIGRTRLMMQVQLADCRD